MDHKIILLTFVVATSFEIECQVKILGGLNVVISKFPYQISLHSLEKKQFFGGGSIISDRHILTAAHCVVNKAFHYYVRVGSNLATSGGYIYNVWKVIDHPKFNNLSLDYDLSLLILQKPIIFSKNAAAISLPKQDYRIRSGTKVLISGWGLYSNTQKPGDFSLSLKYTEIELISFKKCVEEYKKSIIASILKREVTNNMICGHTKGKDACHGDSGGPAVFNGTLVGIISWGDGCGGNFPGVYTKVYQFVEWIQGTIKSNPTDYLLIKEKTS